MSNAISLREWSKVNSDIDRLTAVTGDLVHYFRERLHAEETYVKHLTKLSPPGSGSVFGTAVVNETSVVVAKKEQYIRVVSEEVVKPLDASLGTSQWANYQRERSHLAGVVGEYERATKKNKQNAINALATDLQLNLPVFLSQSVSLHASHTTVIKDALTRYGTLIADIGKEHMDAGEQLVISVLNVETPAAGTDAFASREPALTGIRADLAAARASPGRASHSSREPVTAASTAYHDGDSQSAHSSVSSRPGASGRFASILRRDRSNSNRGEHRPAEKAPPLPTPKSKRISGLFRRQSKVFPSSLVKSDGYKQQPTVFEEEPVDEPSDEPAAYGSTFTDRRVVSDAPTVTPARPRGSLLDDDDDIVASPTLAPTAAAVPEASNEDEGDKRAAMAALQNRLSTANVAAPLSRRATRKATRQSTAPPLPPPTRQPTNASVASSDDVPLAQIVDAHRAQSGGNGDISAHDANPYFASAAHTPSTNPYDAPVANGAGGLSNGTAGVAAGTAAAAAAATAAVVASTGTGTPGSSDTTYQTASPQARSPAALNNTSGFFGTGAISQSPFSETAPSNSPFAVASPTFSVGSPRSLSIVSNATSASRYGVPDPFAGETSPGLRAAVTETVHVLLKDNQVSRVMVTGEISALYIGTAPATVHITTPFPLEKFAPNPAYLTAAGDGTYTIKPVARTTTVFKYQLKLDAADAAAFLPIVGSAQWKIEATQAKVIVNYQTSSASTLVVDSVAISIPAQGLTTYQAKPSAVVHNGQLVFANAAPSGKLLAAIQTPTPAMHPVSFKWTASSVASGVSLTAETPLVSALASTKAGKYYIS